MATKLVLNEGDKVRVYGIPVTGTQRVDHYDGSSMTEGKMKPVSGFIYNMEESGRGWSAVNSYYMAEQAYLDATVIKTKWGLMFVIDEKHLGLKYNNWARKPYVRKNGQTNPNLTVCNYLGGHLPAWRKIDNFPMYGLGCNAEFGSMFSTKHRIELR